MHTSRTFLSYRRASDISVKHCQSCTRGAISAEKLRGAKVWVPTPGRQRPSWVLGAGGGLPLSLWGSRGITAGKFLKTQMLNPALWWLLAVKFLAFWKLRPRSWGTNTLLVPHSHPVPMVVAPMAGTDIRRLSLSLRWRNKHYVVSRLWKHSRSNWECNTMFSIRCCWLHFSR